MQVFMMLPVLLLGMVPALQGPLLTIVHGVTLLNGRVISERVRRTKGSVHPSLTPPSPASATTGALV